MAAHFGRLMRINFQQKVLPCPALTHRLTAVVQAVPAVCAQQVRYPSHKHYDPKWKKLRRKKVYKFDLPDYGKLLKDSKMGPAEMRTKMKKDKKPPPRVFQERPINISATGAVFEPFVPPEGDGKSSLISTSGVKQRYTEIEKKGKSFLELRKVRQYEDHFDIKDFAHLAQNIVIEAQKCLEDPLKNEDRLHELVTEKAFPEMVFGLLNKTFRWQFVESVEPPRVTHVRTTEVLSKDNLYAQVTVRMHTKQILAIYDRFGRLMYGSEDVAKDCLEYIVMEKHISNLYGTWRVHSKIIPDWMPPREPIRRTYMEKKFDPIEEETKSDVVKTDTDKEAQAVNAS